MRSGVAVFGVVLVMGMPVAEAQPEASSASEAVPGSAPVSVSAPVSASVPVSVSASVPVSAPASVSVLVASVQGAGGVRAAYADRVARALSGALAERGYTVVSDQALGETLVACGTLGCIEQTLEGVGASFGVVAAMWIRAGDRRELTLTLVGKSGRNLNTGTVIDGDLSQTAAALVDELLARRSELEAGAPDGSAADRFAIAVDGGTPVGEAGSKTPTPTDATQTRARPNAWKAGPIVLWVGGAAVFVGIGAAAGMKDETQQLNKGAVAAWSVIGAAALAGGTAWWVVGERRRRRQSERSAPTPDTAIRVTPRGFDLRLRF